MSLPMPNVLERVLLVVISTTDMDFEAFLPKTKPNRSDLLISQRGRWARGGTHYTRSTAWWSKVTSSFIRGG